MEASSPEKSPRLTRIAPTPSGFLHAGNVASFVLTAGLAREWGAEVLLRIDDMDRERFRREYLEDVFETLGFLGIPWDRGPRNADDFESHWSQRHRLGIYEGHLRRLAESGNAFACLCSRTELAAAGKEHPAACIEAGYPLDTPGAAWRLKPFHSMHVPLRSFDGEIRKHSLSGPSSCPVVRKKDGFPAYHLCSVADDVHFGVDAVVRGEDLFESTLLQLHLAGLLGLGSFTSAGFLHHPLLLQSEGGKLSKSAGSTSVMHMRKRGMRPSEVYSAIAGMVSPGSKAGSFEELFSLLRERWMPD
jgi:glutamyl/glutaminyl-tRNA synthetase